MFVAPILGAVIAGLGACGGSSDKSAPTPGINSVPANCSTSTNARSASLKIAKVEAVNSRLVKLTIVMHSNTGAPLCHMILQPEADTAASGKAGMVYSNPYGTLDITVPTTNVTVAKYLSTNGQVTRYCVFLFNQLQRGGQFGTLAGRAGTDGCVPVR